MSEHQSAARQALLTEAAAELSADVQVGDHDNYLHAYYRHVDSSDLSAAGPNRVGSVAAEHADLASERPQGRAVVRVRSGAEATLLAGRDVIDVVTDDMPFLVDTLTMTLASHDVKAELVVHPQLNVRRDITGSLREVIRPIDVARPVDSPRIPGAAVGQDLIAESWSHIEVAKLPAGKGEAIAADLEQALADVRMAVEDYPKMRAMALRIADELAAGTAGSRSTGSRSTGSQSTSMTGSWAVPGAKAAAGATAGSEATAAPGSGAAEAFSEAGASMPPATCTLNETSKRTRS